MRWNEADEIIRSIRNAPKEEILEAFRVALLASPSREHVRAANKHMCLDEGIASAAVPMATLMPNEPFSTPTPFYLALQSAKAAI